VPISTIRHPEERPASLGASRRTQQGFSLNDLSSSPRAGLITRDPLANRSLVGRLVWLAAGWSVMLLIGTGVGLSLSFRDHAYGEFERGLIEDIDSLLAGSTVADDEQVVAPFLTDARATRAYSGKYWEVLDPAKGPGMKDPVASRSLWDQLLTVPPSVIDRLSKARNQTLFYNTIGPLKQPLHAAARMILLPGRPGPVVFVVAEDRSPIDRDIRKFEVTTAIFLLILGAGLVAAVVIQVRVGLTPLFAMGREIADVRRGKAQRVTGRYPSELAPLAAEMNALLDHNQDVVERQRTHVGNLAHALKTPISVMLAEADGAPGPLAEVVARQAEAMRGHVEHHLRRARAAARLQGSGERTPVAPVLAELARTLERIFQDKGVLIEWECDAELAFLGERQDLQELAGNVLENACKWCRELVSVEVAADGAQKLILTVEDDGPGLKPEQRAEVLKRGARLDESAPGSGLGLAIVDELARAYGGALTLSDSPLGGLKITLVLPRAAA
jgi:signal transduction histidine kinase